MIKIAPSILSADFARLGAEVQEAEAGGADYIHVDVMDGHFVPNLTIGPPVIAALRRVTNLPLDVHLMIEEPDRYLAEYTAAGATFLTVHVETCQHLHRTIQRIRELGGKPGVSLNPATSIDTIAEILPYVEQVLVMTVNPGFGGQRYIGTMTDKIARLARIASAKGLELAIEVDGGIDATTAPEAVRAGARVLVAGTAVFRHPEGIARGVTNLRGAAEAALA